MSRLIGGRYELGEEIGRGGMATVHAAYDTRLGRPVAIKMLHAGRLGDRSFQGRFRREAQAAASLSHPNIVAVFDSGEDVLTTSVGVQEVIPYIVMELVQGHTLSQLMHDHGPFAPDDAMRIVEKVLAALGYSHDRGLVHRDVKPGNVMLTPAGDVKVMDFGIARGGAEATATMTQTQAVIGTAQYLSPEQARGQDVDGRSDLYSAGCLLFELVAGRPPFVGDSPLAIAYQHVGEDPSLPSSHEHSIPRSLDTVIMHALIKDRERRYQSADSFRRDLEAARAGRPLSDEARATASALFAPTESIQRTEAPPASYADGARAGGGATAAGAGLGAAAGATAAGIRPGVEGPGRDGPVTSSYPAVAEDDNRRYVAWIAVLVALLALTGLGVWWLTRPDPIAYKTVPVLVGETEATARSKLQSSGLQGSFTTKTSRSPKGTVVETDPPAGSQQDPANPVTVVLSSGPSEVVVPDVRKYTTASAQQRLTNASLAAGAVKVVDDKTIPEGQVVRTDPAIGQTVPVGSKVALFVSSGKMPVPNVVGQDWEGAAKALTDAGFRVARQDKPSTQTPGTVLDQDINDGSQPPGTKITLTVAVVTPTTTVTVTSTAPAPPPTTPAPAPPSPRPTSTPTPTPTGTAPPTTQPTPAPPTTPPTP
ncbi:Stk1 family PASTA domain-containing Ser/Thr kinase [Arsenicicoccus sp. oral taxon 190]|uniref:Stk1 family PASTA domain-containing Ser/Thr kinase n=1 Tax=Arsenicicoccus sp. oral taxon 190 TaxID=1658671 RepID=UPI00067A1C45|nr:Stk1 family PASTA domain-containing Ser/Thr kinase [Arsenicicoccus sp. oral taxon 190]AKT50837.1 hypothetical protein ADJ73_05100 [Arsenicicoccus sp. oral taxon 190]